jgi:hypothetical protein
MARLNTQFQVPYLAGYSQDDETIYIDKRVPRYWMLGGKEVDVYPFLIVHECVEKSLEDTCGYSYQYSHEAATKQERRAVERAGVNWDEYQKAMLGEVKKIEELTGVVPDDLDLKPEADWHDTHELHEIRKWQLNPEEPEDASGE